MAQIDQEDVYILDTSDTTLSFTGHGTFFLKQGYISVEQVIVNFIIPEFLTTLKSCYGAN